MAGESELESGLAIQAVSATLPRTCSVERLAEFFAQRLRGGGKQPRVGYPAGYFQWLAGIPGRDRYMDAALIDEHRDVVGAAISRPLTLGMWSNMKLRSAIREAVAEGEREKATKGWVRYLTREKDAELASALATLLPEEHFALKAVVVEFLGVVPKLEHTSHERLLLELVLTEARAAGYDYLLCWSDGHRLPPSLAAHAATAEAVLEVMAEADAGILRLYNDARYAARALRQWAVETWDRLRRGVRQLRLRLRRARASLRRLLAGKGAGAKLEPAPLDAPTGPGDEIPAPRRARSAPLEEALTFDGIRIRCVGGPNLPLDEALGRSLRDLMVDTQDQYGVFPTYDEPELRDLLAPARAHRRLTSFYAIHGRDRESVLAGTEDHDVLSYVATKGNRALALLFGHRLPCFEGEGLVRESWLIRASFFREGLGPFARADIIQRCAEAAAGQYGIERAIRLRHAGLIDLLFSRLIMGSRRTPDRLSLHYVPLSERARAEEAVLERRLPVGYV